MSEPAQNCDNSILKENFLTVYCFQTGLGILVLFNLGEN